MDSIQALLTDTYSLRRAAVVELPEFPTDVLPIVYGDMIGGKNGLVYCPGIVEETNTYLIADHAIVSEANGNTPTFYVDNTEVVPASWTEATTIAGQIVATVTMATSFAGSRIGYRGQGRASLAGTLIENPVSVVEDFLSTFVGVSADDFDRTALETARSRAAAFEYKCAGVIDADRPPSTTISEILACFGGFYYIDPAGKIVIVIDDGTVPALSGTSEHVRSHEFEAMEATWTRADIVNRAAVNYTRNSYDITLQQRFQDSDDGIAAQDSRSVQLHGASGPGSTEAALEFAWCRDGDTIQRVQRVIVARLATPRAKIRTSVPGWRLAHLDVGDHVGFSCDRLFDEYGRRLKNQVGLIEEIAVDCDAIKVDLTFRDTGAYIARAEIADGSVKADGTALAGADRDLRDY